MAAPIPQILPQEAATEGCWLEVLSNSYDYSNQFSIWRGTDFGYNAHPANGWRLDYVEFDRLVIADGRQLSNTYVLINNTISPGSYSFFAEDYYEMNGDVHESRVTAIRAHFIRTGSGMILHSNSSGRVLRGLSGTILFS